MRDLPAGTLTLLFTDIEGCIRLFQELRERCPIVLDERRLQVCSHST